MPFKKLNEPLLEAIDRVGLENPFPFQKEIISKIKGGANVYGIAPKGSGKTISMIISVIQKLNSAAFEDAPRAIIIVKDKQAALELEHLIKDFVYRMDLRVYSAYEEHNIDIQKDEIYAGVDIVIATPKRLGKLFHLNGINLGEVKLFIIEDAEFLANSSDYSSVVRLPESINKCQYVIFASELHQRLERLKDTFMYNAQTVKISK